jgi:hypothetical protein
MFYSLDNFYVQLISYKNRLELQKNDPYGRIYSSNNIIKYLCKALPIWIYIYEAGQGDRVWWQINRFFSEYIGLLLLRGFVDTKWSKWVGVYWCLQYQMSL